MAKKIFLRDLSGAEVLPITRGELVLDSSGNPAFHSNEFLATESQPGLMSAEDKKRIDDLENTGPGANNKVAQVNTTTSDVYRLLFSETATDETKTEGARKSAKLTFNPSTGVLQTTALIGNLDGTYVNKLTGYTKATTVAGITSEDSLSTALGKLELKADTTYDLVRGAYDGDGTIENLAEILKVLEGISDTETIQAIVGKYLPLSGGTIIGSGDYTSTPITIKSGNSSYVGIAFSAGSNHNNGGAVRYYSGLDGVGLLNRATDAEIAVSDVAYFTTDAGTTKYPLIHSGNIGSQIVEGITTHTGDAINADGDIAKLNSYYSSKGFRISRFNGLNGLGTKNSDGLIINWPLDYAYGQQWYMDDESHTIQTRHVSGGTWSEWKTIAFTDSNVASAYKLVTSDGSNMVHFDSATLYVGDTIYKSYNTNILGKNVVLRYGASATNGLILNSLGNVTIGSSDRANASFKLFAEGPGAFEQADGTRVLLEGGVDGNGGGGLAFFDVSGFKRGTITAKPLILNAIGGGNVLIGTTADSGNKLYVSGDTRFDGQTRISGSMRFYGKTNLSSDMYIDNQSVGGLNFAWSDGVTRFFIGNNVGIGTTDPAYRLDVNGIIHASEFKSLVSNDHYKMLEMGVINGRLLRVHTAAGISGVSGRMAALSLYEGESCYGSIGVTTTGPVWIDSSFTRHELLHSGSGLTTITKTLTVTKDWMDTGIKYTDLTRGTYAVQVSCNAHSNYIYDSIWSGVMTWYSDSTNGTDSDEIVLHRGSHACNDRTIYLRTINSVGTAGTNMRLQIAASANFASATYTFKFKKLI